MQYTYEVVDSDSGILIDGKRNQLIKVTREDGYSLKIDIHDFAESAFLRDAKFRTTKEQAMWESVYPVSKSFSYDRLGNPTNEAW